MLSCIKRVPVKYPFDYEYAFSLWTTFFFRWSHFGNTEMVTVICYKSTGFSGSSLFKALCDIFCPIGQEFWVENVSKMSGMSEI